jgi:hypothetical protein
MSRKKGFKGLRHNRGFWGYYIVDIIYNMGAPMNPIQDLETRRNAILEEMRSSWFAAVLGTDFST